MKPLVPILVTLILALIAAVVFYQIQSIENATVMLVVSLIVFAISLVLVWLIPADKWAFFWRPLALVSSGSCSSSLPLRSRALSRMPITRCSEWPSAFLRARLAPARRRTFSNAAKGVANDAPGER